MLKLAFHIVSLHHRETHSYFVFTNYNNVEVGISLQRMVVNAISVCMTFLNMY